MRRDCPDGPSELPPDGTALSSVPHQAAPAPEKSRSSSEPSTNPTSSAETEAHQRAGALPLHIPRRRTTPTPTRNRQRRAPEGAASVFRGYPSPQSHRPPDHVGTSGSTPRLRYGPSGEPTRSSRSQPPSNTIAEWISTLRPPSRHAEPLRNPSKITPKFDFA